MSDAQLDLAAATAQASDGLEALATPPARPRLTRRRRGRNGASYSVDGERVDSVTTIIREGVPKPALQGWNAREVAAAAVRHRAILPNLSDEEMTDLLSRAPYRTRDKAANRGTEVHRLADALARGEEVQVPPELEQHVTGYVGFLEEWDPAGALVERPCFNLSLRYGGTFDLLAETARTGRTLFDIKTSGSGIFGEIALQLAGYGRAEVYIGEDDEVHDMPTIDTYAAIWVTERGYDVFEVEVGEHEWRAFRSAAQVAWWREARMDRVVGDSMWTSQGVSR